MYLIVCFRFSIYVLVEPYNNHIRILYVRMYILYIRIHSHIDSSPPPSSLLSSHKHARTHDSISGSVLSRRFSVLNFVCLRAFIALRLYSVSRVHTLHRVCRQQQQQQNYTILQKQRKMNLYRVRYGALFNTTQYCYVCSINW